MYDWCIRAAEKPYATWLMGFISFIESSFFPIPPDTMMIPMALARPDRAWFYAHICTLTSVAGGVLGYFIGAVLYDSVGGWLIALYGYGSKVDAFRAAYATWGTWIILLKGVTPIPYKLLAIAAGLVFFRRHEKMLVARAEAELRAMGEEVPEEPGLLDRYRQVRDTRAARTEIAVPEHLQTLPAPVSKSAAAAIMIAGVGGRVRVASRGGVRDRGRGARTRVPARHSDNPVRQ